MPDYSNGKIYRIIGGDNVYYGSTTATLEARFYQHKMANRNVHHLLYSCMMIVV